MPMSVFLKDVGWSPISLFLLLKEGFWIERTSLWHPSMKFWRIVAFVEFVKEFDPLVHRGGLPCEQIEHQVPLGVFLIGPLRILCSWRKNSRRHVPWHSSFPRVLWLWWQRWQWPHPPYMVSIFKGGFTKRLISPTCGKRNPPTWHRWRLLWSISFNTWKTTRESSMFLEAWRQRWATFSRHSIGTSPHWVMREPDKTPKNIEKWVGSDVWREMVLKSTQGLRCIPEPKDVPGFFTKNVRNLSKHFLKEIIYFSCFPGRGGGNGREWELIDREDILSQLAKEDLDTVLTFIKQKTVKVHGHLKHMGVQQSVRSTQTFLSGSLLTFGPCKMRLSWSSFPMCSSARPPPLGTLVPFQARTVFANSPALSLVLTKTWTLRHGIRASVTLPQSTPVAPTWPEPVTNDLSTDQRPCYQEIYQCFWA